MIKIHAGAAQRAMTSKRQTAGLAMALALVSSAVIAQSVTNPRVFVVETVTRQVQSQFPQRGAVQSYLISEGSFDPDDNGRFEHEQLFRQVFTNYIPADYTGAVCLNWEGQGMAGLRAPIGSTYQRETIRSYVQLLSLAKELRPNAQIGFYNLPMREYWNRDQAWRDRNLSLQIIIDASDCLFPSIYDFYKTGEWSGHDPKSDLLYVQECVGMALEMANGKPVYPYISPRYHLSNYVYGMQLIPGAEFKSHIGAAFDVAYKGDRADGLVWWGADRYYRWLGRQNYPPAHPQFWVSYVCRRVFDAEISQTASDDSHFTTIHRKTLRQISDVINGAL
jgi:hypothetical protein